MSTLGGLASTIGFTAIALLFLSALALVLILLWRNLE